MTPRKGFPNVAEHSRSESVAQAKKILLETAPMAAAIREGKTVTSLEMMIRIRQIETAAYKIIEELGQFSPRKVSSDP